MHGPVVGMRTDLAGEWIVKVQLKLWMIAVFWPSFVLAAIATGVFFSTFDPQQLMPFDRPTSLSRLAAYSTGFLTFWAFSALSIAVGIYFVTLNNGPQSNAADGAEDG